MQQPAPQKPVVESESKHSNDGNDLVVVTAQTDLSFVTSPSAHLRTGSSSTRLLAVRCVVFFFPLFFLAGGRASIDASPAQASVPASRTGRCSDIACVLLPLCGCAPSVVQMRQLSVSVAQPHEKRLLSRVPSQRLLSALSNRVRRFSVAYVPRACSVCYAASRGCRLCCPCCVGIPLW